MMRITFPEALMFPDYFDSVYDYRRSGHSLPEAIDEPAGKPLVVIEKVHNRHTAGVQLDLQSPG
jgi:hypothetical protein